MAVTDPFPADVEAWLEEDIKHLYQVTILPVTGPSFDVAVVGRLDVTYDMDWTPSAQVAMTILTPTDAAQVTALDSRLGTRVRIRTGYRRLGMDYWGTDATLRLHSVDDPTPGTHTDITAQGTEMVLLDMSSLKEGPSAMDFYTDRSGMDAFVRSWINRSWEPGPKPAIVSTIPGGAWNEYLVRDYKHAGGSNWSAIEGAAQAAGIRVYDDGTGTWRIDYLPWLTAYIAASLTTGPGGTLTTEDRNVDRDRWCNRVFLQYDFDNAGTPNTVSGIAWINSGPYKATAPNIREYREYITGEVVTTGYANGRAVNLLRKYSLRGASKSVTAAAAYWLRPGMTLRHRTKATDPWETSLVSAVTFSPLTGSMAVRTTRPEDYETGT